MDEAAVFLKAQLSSGAATALDWGLLTVLVALGLHYELAICAGAVAGGLTDFFIKRHWAFGSGEGPLGRGMRRYLLVSASSLGLNCALAYLLVDILKAPKVPGAIGAAVVVGVVWNYPLHRWYVFGRLSRKV